MAFLLLFYCTLVPHQQLHTPIPLPDTGDVYYTFCVCCLLSTHTPAGPHTAVTCSVVPDPQFVPCVTCHCVVPVPVYFCVTTFPTTWWRDLHRTDTTFFLLTPHSPHCPTAHTLPRRAYPLPTFTLLPTSCWFTPFTLVYCISAFFLLFMHTHIVQGLFPHCLWEDCVQLFALFIHSTTP